MFVIIQIHHFVCSAFNHTVMRTKQNSLILNTILMEMLLLLLPL